MEFNYGKVGKPGFPLTRFDHWQVECTVFDRIWLIREVEWELKFLFVLLFNSEV